MTKPTFLNVNGNELSVDDTQSLAYLLDGYDIRSSLKTHMAVLEMARAKGLTLTPDDMREEFDEYRYETGLEQSVAVQTWKQDNQITDNAIRIYCEISAYRKKLSEAIPSEAVRASFEEISSKEVVYFLFFLPLETEEIAHEVATRIQNGDVSFNDAVNQYGDRDTRAVGGYMGELVRDELSKPLALAVSSVDPGTMVGPFVEEDQWYIVYVADQVEPEFEDFEQSLRDALVEDELQYYFDRTVVMNAG